MARIQRSSGLGNPLQKVFPLPIIATRVPGTSDTNYQAGQVWINKSTNQAWFLTSVSAGSATWALASPGASDVDTLTGDSGGALSPAAGNITLAGGTNITTAGAASTITFNLDAAITLATSVTSPLYTVGAGTDLAITSAAGQDIVMKMGDAAGANKVSFVDSADAEVFSIDSNGSIGTLAGLTVTGAFTTSGGAASINASSNFNTVINSGTSTGTVTIGNGAAGAVTVDSGAGISLDAATASNFTVSAAAADLTLGSTLGTVIVNAGEDTADAIYLHANAGTSETIRLHADQGTGVDSVKLESDVGGITLVATGLATSDAINLEATAGGIDMDAALDIVLTSTENAADSIYLHANGGTSEQIRLHADQGTGVGSVQLESDVGGITLLSGLASADAINLTASAGGLDLDGALQVNVASSQAAADAVVINASAGGVDVIAATNDLDLTASTASINLTAAEADAGAISLQAAAGGLDIDTGLAIIADAAGNVEVNSSAGQILIGNDDVDQNASFATDGERTVTVGSTNGAAALVLQAGTGNITMTGTIEAVDAKFVRPTGLDYTFRSSPTTSTAADTAGVAVGTTGATNLLGFPGFVMEQFILGAGQTIIKPTMDNSGLLCSLDLTSTEGAEYNFGAARTLSEYAFTVGTSAAFFFEVTMTIADISGGNPYMIGFRKAEANNATLASYTDYYGLGMFGGTSATNVTLVSELNSGGQTLQDSGTAWTGGDGGTVTLKVLVSAAGVVTATIDGGAPSSPLAFTFDSTDVICPFIRIEHGATSPGAVHLVDLSVGFQ